MQKLDLRQILSQKLSPQQIQFIKLLQIPTAELESRIEEELEINPALEEGKEEENSDEYEAEEYQEKEGTDDISLDEYIQNEDIAGYKMYGDGGSPDGDDKELPVANAQTFIQNLKNQLSYLRLNEHEYQLGYHLVGCVDEDGYIRRDLAAIALDLAFTQGVTTDAEELEAILFKIQGFDPAGVGARNLQECLSLQLRRKDDSLEAVQIAQKVIDAHFEEFTKKHYKKIIKRLKITEEQLKAGVNIITKLNPKPGGSTASGSSTSAYVIPDYILKNNNNELEIVLNGRNAPELNVSRSYQEMFKAYEKSDKKDARMKETVQFVKQKLDAAKWFIDAIRQRQHTLMITMQAILNFQHEYFLDGDESKLRPMILKDIADTIQMDISTVSRVANNKYIQTDWGTFPLKYFFSEGISTDSGEDASSREVKSKLKAIVEAENKSKPLSDEKIEKLLKEQGYNIARRTVAKYREQLEIPVARLRKEL